jgi:hypothetical protein
MTSINSHNYCLVCKKSNLAKLDYINEPFYDEEVINFSKLNIIYCHDCGFGWSIPEIQIELLNKFYKDIYRSNGQPHFINFSRLYRPKFSQCTLAIEHFSLARLFTAVNSGDSLLDIGPGPGWHFQAARSLLENPKLYAIEYNLGASEAYKKLYDVNSFINIEDLRSNVKHKMKFIVASHSLEHFKYNDLIEFLTDIKTILMDDGVFIIEVPHVDMRTHSKYRGGDSPHLLFFSKKSLKSVLVSCGYEVKFIESTGQLYEVEDNQELSLKPSNNLTKWIKDLYKIIFPFWFRNSKFKRSLKALIFYLGSSSSKIKLSQLKTNYGGNRVALRVVAKKKQNI